MISKSNFELATPMLQWQLKQRGEIKPLKQEKWDTYAGWNKRGKFISSGSEGYRVELVVPYKSYDTEKKPKTEFALRNKVLFSEDQTC